MANSTSLFKYRAFNKTSIELLVNRELWFAKPETLNDPFEAMPSFSRALDAAWNEYSDNNFEKSDIENKLKNLLKNVGICSFSRTRKNQLMWAHYADEHNGFCIGFNRKEINVQEDVPISVDVKYQSDLPYKGILERFSIFKKMDLPNGLQEIQGDIMYSIIGTKYTNWKYEKETRLVRNSSGALKFHPKAINSIAFGLRMRDKDKKTLYKLLNGREWSHVKWYQAEKVSGKFALNFKPLKNITRHSS